MSDSCPLCTGTGGELLWQDEFCRVVLVDEPGFPGYCRVILNRHTAEMTDLEDQERERLMRVVYAVEKAIRHTLNPDKINLASLGNQVPHLHWHLIPRWQEDSHFPASIWAAPFRSGNVALPAKALIDLRNTLEHLTP
ncbi:Diadenosine tetraphosphate (Ap4A) hydrolase [Formivibrio citricus]|uniref:Diadenosine tetraphosphate (Ap4A) hydrolase n=1 Tax=Formivibrio citricus TaxID=83765 RepID=A0A1I4XU45_9NEIS|nr:HIT family protein [Formivibrio citricus]SFN29186.1 Diadenosine tetraphosphate (Ap4A) hydrolase [Formivibrio citricus]